MTNLEYIPLRRRKIYLIDPSALNELESGNDNRLKSFCSPLLRTLGGSICSIICPSSISNDTTAIAVIHSTLYSSL